ncbi:MAG: MBL fold metallo-hydrolase [Synergistaceae bacterium]
MLYNHGDGIFAVDSHYRREKNTAVYIIKDSGKAAVIESATNSSLPLVINALDSIGVARNDVLYLFLTHVHLDHAGGAGVYMENFPNATLVVHSRGTRHLIAPSKLISSVKSVYGESEYNKLYGGISPIDSERIISAGDGYEFCVGERVLRCLATPGHAKHHLSFLDKKTSSVFVGDSFGTSYPEMETINGRWLIPSTSPVQFNPCEMHQSIDYTLSFSPKKIFLTHFGELKNFKHCVYSLHKNIDLYVNYAVKLNGDVELLRKQMRDNFIQSAMLFNIPDPVSFVDVFCHHLVDLNAQGLSIWYSSLNK